MNKNTACFAFAAKCGCFGASAYGAAFATASLALARFEKNPSRDNRSMSASPAKPPPTCHRNSRRLLPHGVGFGMYRFIELPPPDQLHQIVPKTFTTNQKRRRMRRAQEPPWVPPFVVSLDSSWILLSCSFTLLSPMAATQALDHAH